MSEIEKQPDKRIGKHGHYEPQICAVTGQPVNGRHNSNYALATGYYYRVLDKVATFSRDDVKSALLPIIAPKRKASIKSKEVISDDE